MKRLFKSLSLIICICLCAVSLCCSQTNVMTFSAFTAPVRIETRNKGLSQQMQSDIIDIFTSLEDTFDVKNEQSILYKINSADLNQPISIDKSVSEVLSISRYLYDFTDKKFNPATYPLTSLWKFNNYPVLNFSPPKLEDVEALLGDAIDFNHLSFNEQSCVKNYDIQIDLGGILKGYAVDKILELLIQNGYTQGYVNVGGSSLALLSVPSLEIRHPRANDKFSSILSIDTSNKHNVTVSTSGDYERFYEYEGHRYCHVIDPENGQPITTGVQSATIIGCSGAVSDGLTTALCIYKHTPVDVHNSPLINFMKKIISEYNGCDLFVVYQDEQVKQLITNKEQGKVFTLFDTSYQVVKI